MGLSLGGSLGGTDSKSTGTSSGTQSATFSPAQSGIQGLLASLFQTLIPSMTSGQLSPATAAVTTGNADQINKNYATVGDTLQSKLAARGMAGSGQSGETTLQTELARQGAQAGNLEAGGASQLQQNNSSLLDALNYAFTSLGSSSSAAGASTGNTSGWGVGGGVSAAVPGFG